MPNHKNIFTSRITILVSRITILDFFQDYFFSFHLDLIIYYNEFAHKNVLLNTIRKVLDLRQCIKPQSVLSAGTCFMLSTALRIL